MEKDYWFEDLFPQTWQDVLEALNYTFTIKGAFYTHSRAEHIRNMYWSFLEER